MTDANITVLASLVLSALLCAAALPAFAIKGSGSEPRTNPQEATALLPGLPLGAEVASIKNIERISDWKTLDTKHLTLKINNAQSYLLTLQDPCMHLRGARIVGVSMTNQEIWADFDYIAADGRECRIDTIKRLGRKKS